MNDAKAVEEKKDTRPRADRRREKKANDKRVNLEKKYQHARAQTSMTEELVNTYAEALPKEVPFILNREKNKISCPCSEIHEIKKNAKNEKYIECPTFDIKVKSRSIKVLVDKYITEVVKELGALKGSVEEISKD